MNPATKPNPAMAKAAYDLARVRSVIAYWSHVRVRDIDAEPVNLNFGPDIVEITQVTVTAPTTRDAHRLAVLLDLPPEAADPALTWRTWTGWVSQISAQRPVLVRATAPTGATQESS